MRGCGRCITRATRSHASRLLPTSGVRARLLGKIPRLWLQLRQKRPGNPGLRPRLRQHWVALPSQSALPKAHCQQAKALVVRACPESPDRQKPEGAKELGVERRQATVPSTHSAGFAFAVYQGRVLRADFDIFKEGRPATARQLRQGRSGCAVL